MAQKLTASRLGLTTVSQTLRTSQLQEFISTMEEQLVQVSEGDLSSEAEVTSGEEVS